ncbi:MAG: YicC family protein [Fibrobacteria bacterium]|nr:YicC family protein [Fibrobacteria bacterium]
MKTQSMTGFGKAEKIGTDFAVRIEIKTVNNRFLDIQFKMNKILAPLEPELRKVLEKNISRGSVICFIHYEEFGKTSSSMQLNKPLLEKYLNFVKQLKEVLDDDSVINITDILQIPDVVIALPESSDDSLLKDRVVPTFGEACLNLSEMRAQEGKKLMQDMLTRVNSFPAWLTKIKDYLPERQFNYTEKFKEKIKEVAGPDLKLDNDRLMTELSILAEKLDITEELVRFESHVTLFLETCSANPTPGKKLGFILQELLREINTLCNKSMHSGIQHESVAIKEELEKIREQVMNIE